MILIKNAKIYKGTGEVIENGSILIDKGKIKEINNNIKVEENVETIDVKGKIVTPGFIDAHCHLGIFEDGIGFEGEDGNEEVDPVTPHLRAIDAINPMDRTFKEAYEGGVTTVATGPGSANVIAGQFAVIKTYGKRIDDMIVKESVAMKVAFGENPKRVYESQKKSPVTRMATAAILRESLFKAKAYVKKVEKNLTTGIDPYEFDMKLDAMSKVINKEIPLKAHVHRADDIFTAIRIAKEFEVGITLDHCTEGHLIADYIKEENICAIVGPSLTDRSKFELKNLTFETPSVLHKAGVKIAIMTDSPVIPLQYLPLCAGLSIKAGLDEETALKAITINPAEILGIEDRVGSIKVGKDADIVVFDGHPLKDIGCNTLLTMINGNIVHREGI